MTFFFKNFTVFDWSLKINAKTSYSLPSSLKAVLSVSNRQMKTDLDHACLTFYNSLAFSFQIPKFTFIKHQSSAFKTRKGDPAGLIKTLRPPASFDTFLVFSALVAPELSQIGLAPGFGVNSCGGFSISAQNLRLLPFFYNAGVSRLSSPVGFDFSYKFNKLLSRRGSIALAASFLFIPFNEQ